MRIQNSFSLNRNKRKSLQKKRKKERRKNFFQKAVVPYSLFLYPLPVSCKTNLSLVGSLIGTMPHVQVLNQPQISTSVVALCCLTLISMNICEKAVQVGEYLQELIVDFSGMPFRSLLAKDSADS